LLSAEAQVPAVFVDERLSSFAAEQRLIDQKRGGQKITRGQKKKRLDAHAAAGFLQEFLDGGLSAIEV
jgi:RNase H-fold protein (predicted Holliday junction resolvase)